MELLLNEKSLDGQFSSLDEFYKSLPEMSRNLKILKREGIALLKHSTLYQRKITDDMTIFDLQNSKDKVAPIYRDQVRQWKRELSALTMSPPYWDSEDNMNGADISEDSLTEAALRRTDVLSFLHKDYTDVSVKVTCQGQKISVRSAVTTAYLADILYQRNVIDTLSFLKYRYGRRKIMMDYLDSNTNSVKLLQKTEINEVMAALDRFESMSWKEILEDRFFYYKSYKPKGENYFASTEFSHRQIDKFRCGQHSQVRCFGYRKDDRFYVLMIERDHSVSDTG